MAGKSLKAIVRDCRVGVKGVPSHAVNYYSLARQSGGSLRSTS